MGHPTVNLCIHGVKVTALVDTGASCSLLRWDIFDLIVKKKHQSSVLQPAGPLRGVNGSPLHVLGKTQICVNKVSAH